jgi:hypothetical protein
LRSTVTKKCELFQRFAPFFLFGLSHIREEPIRSVLMPWSLDHESSNRLDYPIRSSPISIRTNSNSLAVLLNQLQAVCIAVLLYRLQAVCRGSPIGLVALGIVIGIIKLPRDERRDSKSARLGTKRGMKRGR